MSDFCDSRERPSSPPIKRITGKERRRNRLKRILDELPKKPTKRSFIKFEPILLTICRFFVSFIQKQNQLESEGNCDYFTTCDIIPETEDVLFSTHWTPRTVSSQETATITKQMSLARVESSGKVRKTNMICEGNCSKLLQNEKTRRGHGSGLSNKISLNGEQKAIESSDSVSDAESVISFLGRELSTEVKLGEMKQVRKGKDGSLASPTTLEMIREESVTDLDIVDCEECKNCIQDSEFLESNEEEEEELIDEKTGYKILTRFPSESSMSDYDSEFGEPEVCFINEEVAALRLAKLRKWFDETRYVPQPQQNYWPTTFSFSPVALFVHPVELVRKVVPYRKIPTENEVYEMYVKFLFLAMIPIECVLPSIIYLERLMKMNPGYKIHAANWKTLLSVSLLLAAKMWDDFPRFNVQIPYMFREYDLKSVHQMEDAFLEAIEWKMDIKREEYQSKMDCLLNADSPNTARAQN